MNINCKNYETVRRQVLESKKKESEMIEKERIAFLKSNKIWAWLSIEGDPDES